MEQLEARELMAVDLTGPTVPTEPSAVAVGEPTSTADSAAGRSASTSLGTMISALLRTETRSYDGTLNNLANPEWGSTGEQLLRAAPSDYGDGVSTPAGADRPSAREISNSLVAQDETAPANDRQLSAFIYVWGQFIDHDLDLTEPPAEGRESFNVAVPEGDAYFDPAGTGTQVIRLTRSRFDAATGDDAGNPREQLNQITSWIDGSMIYGSDVATAASLRTLAGGQLKTSAGSLPPTDAAGNYLAGDTRANENVELMAMHALWVREHNSWAAKIARANPRLTDEQVFQAARKIVVAEIQAITSNEFLPALLGTSAVAAYRGYDATTNPGIANEFSTAAFRLGHSLINDDVEFFGNDGRAVRDEVALSEAFNNPALLRDAGADPILKYLASTTAQELDNRIVDSLRNFLFGQPGQGGFDLASLNIQRGRDHGLADYNSVRESYGLERVTSFAEITSDLDKQQALAELYGTVDNIDLWVGALAEDHAAGASVGPLVQAIVSDQFERLRDGDRLWYQNAYSGALRTQLEGTSLADVMRRNTTMTNLQSNVFFLRAEISGQVFADQDRNGVLGRREGGLAGMTVELLNDEGELVDSTVTNGRGSYRFRSFAETGDYQVRVVVPPGRQATTPAVRDVLISRGGLAIGGVNFGVRLGSTPRAAALQAGQVAPAAPAALDDALAAAEASRAADIAQTLDAPATRRPGRRPR